MKFEEYLRMLRWDTNIDIRVIRVKDLTEIENDIFFNAILIPKDLDGDEVVYQVLSDVDDVGDRLNLWPTQFAVIAAWPLTDLVKGAMYIEDTAEDYFESEV